MDEKGVGPVRISLSGVRARVERLAAQVQAEATAMDHWDEYVAVLQRARTNPTPRAAMTPGEFVEWSARVRASRLHRLGQYH